MARRELHGLVVDHTCEAGEDPAELLLGMLPEAPDEARTDLTVETSVVPEGELEVGGRVEFALRGIELRVDEDRFAVVSPDGVIRLPPHPDPLPRWGRGNDRLLSARMRVLLRAPLHGDAAWAFSQLPLLVSLLATLRPRGLHHLHAGALVAPDGRSLVVAGDSGSGKSTLTAALVLAGCGYLGDDVVLVGRSGTARPSTPRPHDGSEQPDGGRHAQDERTLTRLLGFPRAFHLSETSARAVSPRRSPPPPGGGHTREERTERPPGGGQARDERWQLERRTSLGKLALDPRALFPGREVRDAPAPAVILFPTVRDRTDTVLGPLTGAEALGRLVESSALVAVKALPGAREHVALLGRLVDGARAFEVELGRDLLLDAARTASRVLGEALP